MVAGVRGLLQSFDTQRQTGCSIALGLPLLRLKTLTAVLTPSLTARLNACDAMATKTFTLAECEKHTSEKDCWLIIHGKVYDVTKFLDEHPGGYDIVVASSGKDGTEAFEEIGHSNAAKQMLDDYYIGEYAGGDSSAGAAPKKRAAVPATAGSSSFGTLVRALLPLLIILAAVYYQVVYKAAKA